MRSRRKAATKKNGQGRPSCDMAVQTDQIALGSSQMTLNVLDSSSPTLTEKGSEESQVGMTAKMADNVVTSSSGEVSISPPPHHPSSPDLHDNVSSSLVAGGVGRLGMRSTEGKKSTEGQRSTEGHYDSSEPSMSITNTATETGQGEHGTSSKCIIPPLRKTKRRFPGLVRVLQKTQNAVKADPKELHVNEISRTVLPRPSLDRQRRAAADIIGSTRQTKPLDSLQTKSHAQDTLRTMSLTQDTLQTNEFRRPSGTSMLDMDDLVNEITPGQCNVVKVKRMKGRIHGNLAESKARRLTLRSNKINVDGKVVGTVGQTTSNDQRSQMSDYTEEGGQSSLLSDRMDGGQRPQLSDQTVGGQKSQLSDHTEGGQMSQLSDHKEGGQGSQSSYHMDGGQTSQLSDQTEGGQGSQLSDHTEEGQMSEKKGKECNKELQKPKEKDDGSKIERQKYRNRQAKELQKNQNETRKEQKQKGKKTRDDEGQEHGQINMTFDSDAMLEGQLGQKKSSKQWTDVQTKNQPRPVTGNMDKSQTARLGGENRTVNGVDTAVHCAAPRVSYISRIMDKMEGKSKEAISGKVVKIVKKAKQTLSNSERLARKRQTSADDGGLTAKRRKTSTLTTDGNSLDYGDSKTDNYGVNSKTGNHGDSNNADNHGDSNKADSHGDGSKAGNHGDRNKAGNHGDSNNAGNHGDSNKACNHEDSNKAGNHGDSNKAGDHGYSNKAGHHGDTNKTGSHGNNKTGNHGDSSKAGNHGDSNKAGNHGDSNKTGNHGDSNTTGNHGDSNKTVNHGDSNKTGNHGKNKTGNHGDSSKTGNPGNSNKTGNHGDSNKTGNHGDSNKVGTHADSNKAGNHGDRNKAGNHGDSNKADHHGDSNKTGNHGDSNKTGSHGNNNKTGNHGDSSKTGNHGNSNKAGNHGDSNKTGNHGDSSKAGNHGDSNKTGHHGDDNKTDTNSDNHSYKAMASNWKKGTTQTHFAKRRTAGTVWCTKPSKREIVTGPITQDIFPYLDRQTFNRVQTVHNLLAKESANQQAKSRSSDLRQTSCIAKETRLETTKRGVCSRFFDQLGRKRNNFDMRWAVDEHGDRITEDQSSEDGRMTGNDLFTDIPDGQSMYGSEFSVECSTHSPKSSVSKYSTSSPANSQSSGLFPVVQITQFDSASGSRSLESVVSDSVNSDEKEISFGKSLQHDIAVNKKELHADEEVLAARHVEVHPDAKRMKYNRSAKTSAIERLGKCAMRVVSKGEKKANVTESVLTLGGHKDEARFCTTSAALTGKMVDTSTEKTSLVHGDNMKCSCGNKTVFIVTAELHVQNDPIGVEESIVCEPDSSVPEDTLSSLSGSKRANCKNHDKPEDSDCFSSSDDVNVGEMDTPTGSDQDNLEEMNMPDIGYHRNPEEMTTPASSSYGNHEEINTDLGNPEDTDTPSGSDHGNPKEMDTPACGYPGNFEEMNITSGSDRGNPEEMNTPLDSDLVNSDEMDNQSRSDRGNPWEIDTPASGYHSNSEERSIPSGSDHGNSEETDTPVSGYHSNSEEMNTSAGSYHGNLNSVASSSGRNHENLWKAKTTAKDDPHGSADSFQNSRSNTMKTFASQKFKYWRGIGGWEDCLRPKPTKTERFQIVPHRVKHQKAKQTAEKSGLPSKPDKLTTDRVVQKSEKPVAAAAGAPGRPVSDDLDLVTPADVDPKCRTVSTGPTPDGCPGTDSRQVGCQATDIGRLIWAKLGRDRWWPGMLIPGEAAGMKETSVGSSWVYWFGDHKISQICLEKIVPFVYNFNQMIGKKSGKLYLSAVMEALQVCEERCGVQPSGDSTLAWAMDGFCIPQDNNTDLQTSPFDPSPGEELPRDVLENLKKICKKVGERGDTETRSRCREERDHSALDSVKAGERQLEDVCIACDDVDKAVCCKHPLFHGGLCRDCKDELTESLFCYGRDGTNVYCVICGYGGELFVCENLNCGKVYCTDCLELFLGEMTVTKIRKASEWTCFLCTKDDTISGDLLRPRENWQQSIIKLYDTGYRVTDPDLAYLSSDNKHKIRVLSLFDGIGTAKLILNQLGLEIDQYYSSEIDEDAILVSSVHHGGQVIQIGDVTKLNVQKLISLCPIDLVIGGSPCNDFSLANPLRKGFEFGGTGTLFFHYYRVLASIQALNVDRHVFWLYENVASMKTEFKNEMSIFFECAPALWDSKFFSAQMRGRYFWGNIPGMYSTPELSQQYWQNYHLDSMLSPNCNRKATVSRIRTVTTRTNSLKQGKKDDIFPVTMNGKEDGIWISELERVFGFPPHYTDVGNLPPTRRQKLLGKSWSVPVVQHILSPLTQYFALRKGDNSDKQE